MIQKHIRSLFDDLRENKRESCELMTSPDDMHDHFSSLNKIPHTFKQKAKELEEQLAKAENNPTFCKLDLSITKDEVSKCLRA